MAAQVGALRVTVGADITGLQTGMRRAQRQVAQSSSIMKRSVDDLNSSLRGLGTVAGASLGAAGLIGATRTFLRVADAAKSLQAQLKLATSEFGSLERANRDVRNIAEQTRSDLLATADLYAALQRNSGQLGTTQAEVARATQTVAEAFKISGAATSEQSAATRQLIQAFQSGVLRGDEFNSVMENAPRLAKLMADSLGVTTGTLRKMAEEGELTADKLVKAFTDTKFTEGLDAEFKQLPVTFDEAMGQLYNSAVIVISEFDRGGQFSTSIANFVSDGKDGFDELGKSAYNFGQNVSDTFAAVDSIREALGSLQTEGIAAFLGLERATFSWRDALGTALQALDATINRFYNAAASPGNMIARSLGFEEKTNPSNMFGAFQEKTRKARFDAAYKQIMGRSLNDIAAELGMERKPPPFRPPPPKAKKGGGSSKKAPRDRSDDVSFQFDQEIRRAQMDILRAQQSMAVTHDERARLALEILKAEQEARNAELDERVRRAERDFAEKKITAGTLEEVRLQSDKLRLQFSNLDTLEQKAIADKLASDKARDAADLIDSGYDLRIEQLQDESSIAETASERRASELRILDIMKEQERARLKALVADQDASELARAQAQQRLDELDNIYARKGEAAIQGTRGPMEDYLASLPTTAAKAQEALERLQVQGFEGLIDAALELSNGFDSAADSLLKTLKNFFLGMARMELQKGLGSLLQSSGIFGNVTGAISESGASFFGGADASFARGGSFNIKGRPGIDRNLLSLNGIPIANVSYGERVNVSNDNMRGTGRGGLVQQFNFPNSDFDSFRRNSSQAARLAKRKLGI